MMAGMFVNTSSTVQSIFVLQYALFALVYGVASAVLYGPARTAFTRYKYNPKYPPSNLICKEMQRSVIGVLICCGYSSLIAHSNPPPPLPYQKEGLADPPGVLQALFLGVALFMWSDTHFYFVHRALHEVPWLYRNVHKIHHESYNPDPWSGLSFHPVESIMYFSSLLIVYVLPVPYWASWIHALGLLLAPANGHQGHGHCTELNSRSSLEMLIGCKHHYIHHAKFNYNYGSPTSFWDMLFGTEYQEGDKSARAKAASEQAALAAAS